VGAARAEWLPPRPVDEEAGVLRRARVVVGGDSHEARFLTELKRDLELRTLADWVVRQRLLKEAGVAQVITMGGGRKQYQVLVDPAALLEYGVSLQEVEQALRANNLNATGSFAVQGDRERAIRVLGLLGPGSEQVLRELKQVPVRTTDRRTIPLGQVATVREGPEVKRGDASVNGVPGVAVVVSKQPGTDTRALTDRLTEAMREAEATLPADVVLVPDLFKLKNFIDRGVYNVGEALVLGAALVILVLFLFLLNFRTTFISLTAIPLSLAVTVLVFNVVGSVTGRE